MNGLRDKEGLVYELTLDALLARLGDPDCTAADINAARAFMKDNGIEGGIAMKDKEEKLGFEIPDFKVVGVEDDGYRTGTED